MGQLLHALCFVEMIVDFVINARINFHDEISRKQ